MGYSKSSSKNRIYFPTKRGRARLPGKRRKTLLKKKQILAWADDYHDRTGLWPKASSGPIAGGPGETWVGIDYALIKGTRGLLSGSSLAKFLTEHGKVRRWTHQGKELTKEQLLAWADDFHRRTGRWPLNRSGDVPAAPGEKWTNLDQALRVGSRGLPGGSTLVQFLAEHRGLIDRRLRSPLNKVQILAWADAHFQRTGNWPTVYSGSILDAPGETWSGVNSALRRGRRLPQGGSTLFRLLAEERGLTLTKLPRLTPHLILKWADSHFQRTGKWPSTESGPIPDAPGEKWRNINNALARGLRGLPGGSSLSRFLKQHGKKRKRR